MVKLNRDLLKLGAMNSTLLGVHRRPRSYFIARRRAISNEIKYEVTRMMSQTAGLIS